MQGVPEALLFVNMGDDALDVNVKSADVTIPDDVTIPTSLPVSGTRRPAFYQKVGRPETGLR